MLLKVANTSVIDVVLRFEGCDLVLPAESVIELPGSRLKKLRFVDGVVAATFKTVGKDCDPYSCHDHSFKDSVEVIHRLKGGLTYKNALGLGNVYILPKLQNPHGSPLVSLPMLEQEDAVGPSSGFFNHFDETFQFNLPNVIGEFDLAFNEDELSMFCGYLQSFSPLI